MKRTFVVEEAKGGVPVKWVHDSEFETISDATNRAQELAGGKDCYTEPRAGLPHGFFGRKDKMNEPWDARIVVKTN